MRIRLDLAYDGTDYAGWQRQPGHDTVQGRVEQALGRLYRAELTVVAAGRTDAGVHAEHQVAHFDAPCRIPSEGIRAAANGLLPGAIRVLAAREAEPDFHARYHAVAKTYRYHLLTDLPASPLETRYGWAAGALSREAMGEAAGDFVGRHDFRAFFAAPPGETPRTPLRTVRLARFFEADRRLVFEVTADGFLRYMVRRMVGALVGVGRRQLPPGRVREMLSEPMTPGPRFRAPAAGLRLYRVKYRSAFDRRAPS